MGLTKSGEKLDSYFKRLEDGKAAKIEPAHVKKVIVKLQAKQALLKEEIATVKKPSKRERVESKLSIAEDQIQRAEWLLQKIESDPNA